MHLSAVLNWGSAAYVVHRAERDDTDDGFDVQDLKVGTLDSPFFVTFI